LVANVSNGCDAVELLLPESDTEEPDVLELLSADNVELISFSLPLMASATVLVDGARGVVDCMDSLG
jgi:hypothetical protein